MIFSTGTASVGLAVLLYMVTIEVISFLRSSDCCLYDNISSVAYIQTLLNCSTVSAVIYSSTSF